MRVTAFKWLLIGLMVVSFAGRPWTQAWAVSTQGCGASSAGAEQSVHPAVTHEAGTIAAGEPAAAHSDSGKTESADCVKSCAALQVLGLAAMTWLPEAWPQSRSVTIEVALYGHPPKPELSPPIARG